MKLNPSARESFLHGFLEQRDKRCSVTALCGERPTQRVYAQGPMLGHPPGKPSGIQPKRPVGNKANRQKYWFCVGKIYSYFILTMIKSAHVQDRCDPHRLVRSAHPTVFFSSFSTATNKQNMQSALSPWGFYQHWQPKLKSHLYYKVKTTSLCSHSPSSNRKNNI